VVEIRNGDKVNSKMMFEHVRFKQAQGDRPLLSQGYRVVRPTQVASYNG